MKRIILSRLALLIERHGATSSYRVLGAGSRWALILIRTNDPHIRACDWRREPGE